MFVFTVWTSNSTLDSLYSRYALTGKCAESKERDNHEYTVTAIAPTRTEYSQRVTPPAVGCYWKSRWQFYSLSQHRIGRVPLGVTLALGKCPRGVFCDETRGKCVLICTLRRVVS